MTTINGIWFTKICATLVVLSSFFVFSPKSIDFYAFAEQRPQKQKLRLAWQPVPNSKYYMIQVANNVKMNPLITELKYEKNKITLSVPVGIYFFRIRGVSATEDFGPWSDIKEVYVNDFPPKVFAPLPNETVRDLLPDSFMLFHWEAGLRGTIYAIEIKRQNKVLVQQSFKDPLFKWNVKEPGSYLYRIGYRTLTGVDWTSYKNIEVLESAIPKKKDSNLTKKSRLEALESILPWTPRVEFDIYSYSETNAFELKILSFDLGMYHRFQIIPHRLHWGFNGSMTLFSKVSNKSQLSELNTPAARFIYLIIFSKYQILPISQPWRLSPSFGYHYRTMLVSEARYGFTNFFGPQVGLELGMTIDQESAIRAEVDFSPYRSETGLLSNHAFLGGIYYSRCLEGAPDCLKQKVFELGIHLKTLRFASESGHLKYLSTGLNFSLGF